MPLIASPEDVRLAAERLYPKFLNAALADKPDFFPHAVRVKLSLAGVKAAHIAEAHSDVYRLIEGSKERKGVGYRVHLEVSNNRELGKFPNPRQIDFETANDLLRFIGKESEFKTLMMLRDRLLSVFPILDSWCRDSPDALIKYSNSIEGLISVAQYFIQNPRPNVYARQLPVPVDTKFIERHETILTQWLNLLLPGWEVRSDEFDFAPRFGLRAKDDLFLLRVLDQEMVADLKLPCDELALPNYALASLNTDSNDRVIIVENKINLLTLPDMPRTIALGGLGSGVTRLRDIKWLEYREIYYWGDIDAEGFQILASLRKVFPRIQSIMMDSETLARFNHLIGPGTNRSLALPSPLTDDEANVFEKCCQQNIRLEQERIPHCEVEKYFKTIFSNR